MLDNRATRLLNILKKKVEISPLGVAGSGELKVEKKNWKFKNYEILIFSYPNLKNLSKNVGKL